MVLAVGALPPLSVGWGARAPGAPPVPTPMSKTTLKVKNCTYKGLDEDAQSQEPGKETPFFKPLNIF